MFDKGTASYSNAKEYQKMKIAGMQMDSNDSEADSDSEEEEDSIDESEDDDSDKSESEGKEFYNLEEENREHNEERNWWDSDSASV